MARSATPDAGKPYLIGIAGPSCAGKTELGQRLAVLLPAPILALDNYYLDRSDYPAQQRSQFNFDVPESLDHDLFLAHVRALSLGEEVARPVYDFTTHTRTRTTKLIRPGPFVIVEGLFLFHWEDVRALIDTCVFVDLDDRTCLGRRIFRDVNERGRAPEAVIMQFAQTVRPMAEKYVRPTQKFAGVVLCGDDPIDSSVAAVMAHVDRCAYRRAVGT
ncbi:MAG: uridine kinase [Terriglobales bacterium]